MLAALKHLLHLFTYSWRALGPRTLVRDTVKYALDAGARHADHAFDDRFGTDTTAAVTPAEAHIPPERRLGATLYVPSHDGDITTMLTALAWPEAELARTTFVDLGSGKGRVVMLGAMRPFREVVGIELSPVLHATALANVALVRRRGALVAPVRLQNSDAADLVVPAGPLVVYLYHPFGAPLAAEVIGRLVAALAEAPRPVAILYGHPTMQQPYGDDVFAGAGVFRLAVAGERRTARFRIGWSVWTNEAWLAGQVAAGQPARVAALSAQAG